MPRIELMPLASGGVRAKLSHRALSAWESPPTTCTVPRGRLARPSRMNRAAPRTPRPALAVSLRKRQPLAIRGSRRRRDSSEDKCSMAKRMPCSCAPAIDTNNRSRACIMHIVFTIYRTTKNSSEQQQFFGHHTFARLQAIDIDTTGQRFAAATASIPGDVLRTCCKPTRLQSNHALPRQIVDA